MRPHEFERRAVAKARRHLGRTDDVGEHDGPQSEIHGGSRCARCRARIADAAEERLDGGKIDRNDGVGDFTMRLTINRSAVAGSGAWTRQKAAPFCSSNQ